MRTFLWLIALAGITAIGYGWWLDERRQDAAAAPERLATRAAETGLRRMLAGHGGLDFADLVIGPAAGPDLRDFRGRVARDGRKLPVYGQARRLCAKALDAADCWQIAYLEVDGEVEPMPDPPAILAAAKDGAAEIAAALGAPLETADTPAAAAPSAAAPSAAAPKAARELAGKAPALAPIPAAAPPAALAQDAGEARPEPAPGGPAKSGLPPIPAPKPAGWPASVGARDRAADAGPEATHQVILPTVNARAGPGLDRTVVGRLPRGTRLAQIGASDGWGRFVVLSGATRGQEVWAALRILAPLSEDG